jgi:hypothetical protein
MKRKQTIKEWELETGIKLRNLKGFQGKKSSIKSKQYTKETFKIAMEKCEISVKTEKGLEFLQGQAVKDEQWKSYIEYCGNKNNPRNFNRR